MVGLCGCSGGDVTVPVYESGAQASYVAAVASVRFGARDEVFVNFYAAL